jgi:hypothetical protein
MSLMRIWHLNLKDIGGREELIKCGMLFLLYPYIGLIGTSIWNSIFAKGKKDGILLLKLLEFSNNLIAISRMI